MSLIENATRVVKSELHHTSKRWQFLETFIFFTEFIPNLKRKNNISDLISENIFKKIIKLRTTPQSVSLARDTGRYAKPIIPSYNVFCKFCTEHDENEIHFFMFFVKCPQ